MRLHREKLDGRKVISRKIGRPVVFVHRRCPGAIRMIDVLSGGGHGIGISVRVESGVWRKLYRVHSVLLGYPRESRTVQCRAVQMPLERSLFRCREIDQPLSFVNGISPGDFPLASSYLRELLPIQVVEIQMTVAGPFARPQKAIGV